jgi:hypothetical protein
MVDNIEDFTKVDLKTRFLRIYANLPLNERTQIVVVLENEPVTWELARNEIIHETNRGKAILEKLAGLRII